MNSKWKVFKCLFLKKYTGYRKIYLMVGRERERELRWCHKGKGKLSQSLNNLLLHTITLFSKQSWVDIYVNNYCKVGFFIEHYGLSPSLHHQICGKLEKGFKMLPSHWTSSAIGSSLAFPDVPANLYRAAKYSQGTCLSSWFCKYSI